MLRQITKSVLISKIREENLMNPKSEWNYFCIRKMQYKCNCVLKSGNKLSLFFSCLLKHFKEKAQQIKDAVTEAKRVAAQL